MENINDEIIRKLNAIMEDISGIVFCLTNMQQEQQNQRTDIQIVKAYEKQESINNKQRYEVLNARVNGIAKMIKEKK